MAAEHVTEDNPWGVPPTPLTSSIPRYEDTEPMDDWAVDRMEDRMISGIQGKWADDVG